MIRLRNRQSRTDAMRRKRNGDIKKHLSHIAAIDEIMTILNATPPQDPAMMITYDTKDACYACEVGGGDGDDDGGGTVLFYDDLPTPAEPVIPEMTPEQADQVLTRGDLVQAVQIAMTILAGAKSSSDRWAAESFRALEYGIESVVREADKTKGKASKKGKSKVKEAEWVYDSDAYPTSKQRADDLRVVKGALDELTAEDIIDLIPAEDLHRMLNHARAEGYTKALKEQRRASGRTF